MNYKRITSILGAMVVFCSSHSFAAELPDGTLQAGSLTNQQLMRDAMTGVASKVATKGCQKPESLLPYIVQMPAGNVGSRKWVEKWIVTGCGATYPVDIEFSEDGLSAANWVIK